MHGKILNATTLSHSLFNLDPMHTCCVENECLDEYDNVSSGVMQRIDAGQPFGDALQEEFFDWFGIQLSESMLITLIEQFATTR